ncbi:aerial mycelium formation protein [Aquihabitans sp. McL0605]|uniref:RsiG family protein n=1 Tax=Aquihabitans sp. McL0605 TaxID=3415671 RepID=UPI003CF0A5EA
MDPELDRILADDYLDGLADLSVAQLRALRGECQAVETQLSYLRRMVQGRHDIVTGEIDRRGRGGDRYDVSDLVDRLPEILADRIHAPGPGRLPPTMEPGELSGELADRLTEITERVPIESPGEADDEALAAVATELSELEHEVSGFRRRLFDRIDALQAEITNRYRSGEAQVDDVLSGGA